MATPLNSRKSDAEISLPNPLPSSAIAQDFSQAPGHQDSANHAIPLDVFSALVESREDFLGLLAYSLYKRHKIEWIQSHPNDDHDAFKKVALTAQQVELYRNQAEQLAKNFIDVSLEQLVDSMRASIVEEVMVTKIDEVKSTVVQKSDELKPGFLKNVGNHLLGGLASAFVALSLYGVFSLYANYQKDGGLEGGAQQVANSLKSPNAENEVTQSSK